jgi:hypothetical protein
LYRKEENEMKEMKKEINYKDKKYNLVFNFNVMQEIQEEYGSVEEWGKLTDGENGEPNAKAVIFGFTSMINEGIDIKNEEEGTELKPFTKKQVGRMLTEIGLENMTNKMNEVVIESTKSEEKNV